MFRKGWPCRLRVTKSIVLSELHGKLLDFVLGFKYRLQVFRTRYRAQAWRETTPDFYVR